MPNLKHRCVVSMEGHVLLVTVHVIVNMVCRHAMQCCKLYWFVFNLHNVFFSYLKET
jgi:hypothetical protein